MYADVSRNALAFRPRTSRVIWQQGRVQLDADANEQTTALLHYLRALGEDVIGVHAGLGTSFKIDRDRKDPFQIGIAFGHYYVDGIRCSNLPLHFNLFNPQLPKTGTQAATGILYKAQHDLPSDAQAPAPDR